MRPTRKTMAAFGRKNYWQIAGVVIADRFDATTVEKIEYLLQNLTLSPSAH
jgi:hypothetical protein